jgi:hypothetical protein
MVWWLKLIRNADINECERIGPHYHCKGDCKNKQGYYECTCPKHTRSADPYREDCRPDFPRHAKIIIGMYTCDRFTHNGMYIMYRLNCSTALQNIYSVICLFGFMAHFLHSFKWYDVLPLLSVACITLLIDF